MSYLMTEAPRVNLWDAIQARRTGTMWCGYPEWKDGEEEESYLAREDFDGWYLDWLSWQWDANYEASVDEQSQTDPLDTPA